MNKRKDSKLKVKSLREEMVAAESKHLVTQNQKLLLEATQVINNDDDQNIEDDHHQDDQNIEDNHHQDDQDRGDDHHDDSRRGCQQRSSCM